jgi:hypothetical protein
MRNANIQPSQVFETPVCSAAGGKSRLIQPAPSYSRSTERMVVSRHIPKGLRLVRSEYPPDSAQKNGSISAGLETTRTNIREANPTQSNQILLGSTAVSARADSGNCFQMS